MKLLLAFLLVCSVLFSSSIPAFAQATDCTIYPNSPSCVSLDNDGDGQPNGSDPFPNDPTNNDSDGDGQPNNSDPFPNDPNNGNQPSPSPTPSSSPSPTSSPNPSPSPSPSSSPSPSNNNSPANGSGIFGWLGSIWSSLSGFLKAFWGVLSKVFSILLGAITNPFGAVNSFLCLIIDGIALVWPSTPESLKIGSLISSIGTAIPLLGTAVVYDIFSTSASMLAIVLLIKLYKLIPFKMS